MSGLRRHSHADRPSIEAAVGAAEGSKLRAAGPRGVDETDRRLILGRSHFGPCAQPADVPGVAHRDHGDAALLCLRNGLFGCLLGDDLAIAVVAFEHEHGVRLEQNGRMLVWNQLLFPDRRDVGEDADHSVGIMPRDRRVDEVIGDDLRFALVASRSQEDALREIFKNLRWKQHAFSVPFAFVAICNRSYMA